jgi:hypothetical protein
LGESSASLGLLLPSVCELEDAGFGRAIGLSLRRAVRSSSDLGPLLLSVCELEDVGFGWVIDLSPCRVDQ